MGLELVVVDGQQVAAAVVEAHDAVEGPGIGRQGARQHLDVHDVAAVADEGIIVVAGPVAVGRIGRQSADHVEGAHGEGVAEIGVALDQGVGHGQAGQVSQGLGAGQGVVRGRRRMERDARVREGQLERLALAEIGRRRRLQQRHADGIGRGHDVLGRLRRAAGRDGVDLRVDIGGIHIAVETRADGSERIAVPQAGGQVAQLVGGDLRR